MRHRSLLLAAALPSLAACGAPPPPEVAEPIPVVDTDGAAPPAPIAEGPLAEVPPGSLEGTYRIDQGMNPDGSRYQGAVAIQREGDVYRLAWQVGDNAFGGVGIHVDDRLLVGWGPPDSHGVVAYRVDGGKLEGRWASVGSGGTLGVEDLSGAPGLTGRYDIVASRSPGGGSYAGTVDMRPSGDSLLLEWQLSSESYRGVGILDGDMLAVGWGNGDVGVVIYRITGRTLDGRWAAPTGGPLGREVLVPGADDRPSARSGAPGAHRGSALAGG